MTQTDAKPTTSRRALVWCPAEHLAPIGDALEAAGWRVGALGVPPRPQGHDVPAYFADAERFDDPRQAITEHDASIALFVDPTPLDDPAVIKLCARQELKTLAIGPAPDAVRTWTDAKEHERWSARIVPLLSDSVVAQHASDALEPVGSVLSASIRMSAPHHLGGVPARLFDAMHLLHRRLGVPERIDASCTGPRASEGVRALSAELHAHLRYPGLSASVAISDTIHTLGRDALLVCEGGAMRLTDEGFTITAEDGTLLDSGDGGSEPALVEQLRRAIDPRLPAPERYDRAAVLAMCEATALSVRTGEPERPHDLLEMMG